MSVRDVLRAFPPAVYLNAMYRARAASRDLRRLRSRYTGEGAAPPYDRDKVRDRLRGQVRARLERFRSNPGPLRVFWAGVNYPQDHSGFLQAWQSVADVTCFVRESGEYGLQLRDKTCRNYVVPEVVDANSRSLLKQVRAWKDDRSPSLLIGQMWATTIDPAALRQLGEDGVVTVNVAMDDRLAHHWLLQAPHAPALGAVGLAHGVDLTLTTTAECCSWYEAEGGNAIFWPMGSDPDVFRPLEKCLDVVFVGGRYGKRADLVRYLAARGISVTCYGPGWPRGSVDAEKMARVFGQARIILGNGNVGYNDDILTLKQRDFDATMAGATYITSRNPDLGELFEEGREIEFYADFAECLDKVRRYLADPAAAASLGQAARKRALAEHTWAARVRELLEFLDPNLAASAGRTG